MYCNFTVPLVHNDRDVTLVVTEIDYVPEQKLSFYQEQLPEGVDILSGYVLDSKGSEVDFDNVLGSHLYEIVPKVLGMFKEV